MDAFISYSSTDREMAHATKRALSELGIEGFLAHEDLQVSEEWRDAIIEELKIVTIFVALLSRDFAASDWCAQEVGFIISRPDVLIMPLSLDGSVPTGFISRLQSKRVRTESDIQEIVREVLFKKRPRLMIPRWIEKVDNAGSFRGAEAIVGPLVPHFGAFTAQEATYFLTAAFGNSQVWNAGLCKNDYLPKFARQHWSQLPSLLKNLSKKKLEKTETEILAVQ